VNTFWNLTYSFNEKQLADGLNMKNHPWPSLLE